HVLAGDAVRPRSLQQLGILERLGRLLPDVLGNRTVLVADCLGHPRTRLPQGILRGFGLSRLASEVAQRRDTRGDCQPPWTTEYTEQAGEGRLKCGTRSPGHTTNGGLDTAHGPNDAVGGTHHRGERGRHHGADAGQIASLVDEPLASLHTL